MAQSMRLGGGGRFQKLEASIAARGNAGDPAAIAASIGRKKYGKKRMQQLAARGRNPSGNIASALAANAKR